MNNGGVTSQVPEGMNPNARETWPSQELVQSWLGNELDFELRLGEHTPIPDDPEAAARARQFRDVLGLFCSGVTVITSVSEDKPVGMTCQSFSSVSLDPPLIMFSPAKTSRAWPLIRRAGHFCVNILAADQSELSNGMATKGEEKFAGVSWNAATTGAPVIEGVLGYIDCTVQQVVEAGDHYIVVGLVKELSFGDKHGNTTKVDPLLFFQGTYTQPQV